MLNGIQIKSGTGYATHYVNVADYYDESQKIVGFWVGRLQERLGLSGEVADGALDALMAGRSPATGEVLRPLAGAKNSVAANDFVCSAPKSVSLQAMVDPRIIPVFEAACRRAVELLETYVDTRVRVGGRNELRETGEFMAALYLHDTSRALDPQLHMHCVVPNLTWDPVEEKFKAINARRMYEALPLVTEFFRSNLAEALHELGYETEASFDKNGKSLGFEIKGIPASLREKFSQRSKDKTKAVEQLEAELGREATGVEVAGVVRRTRDAKLTNISKAEVRERQFARMTAAERELLGSLRVESEAAVQARTHSPMTAERVEEPELAPEQELKAAAREGPGLREKLGELYWEVRGFAQSRITSATVKSFNYAIDHVFERVSVAKKEKVFEHALRHGRGKVHMAALERLLEQEIKAGRILNQGRSIATKETLEREERLIDNINRGIGKFGQFGLAEEVRTAMRPEEQAAIDTVLDSRDRVVAIQGFAGARTPTVLRVLQDALRGSGVRVTTVTPTGAGLNALRSAGVTEAIPLGRLISEEGKWQDYIPLGHHIFEGQQRSEYRGHVLLVDQAGRISARQLDTFLDVTERLGCRAVLMGDTRQVRSVEAGDAFRILQKDSKLQTVKVSTVIEQRGKYRDALKALREDPALGFAKLSQMGAIRHAESEVLHMETAKRYVELLKKPNRRGDERSVLAVASNRGLLLGTTDAIRSLLRSDKKIRAERNHKTLRNLHFTLAQKRDTRNYKPGQFLVFHKTTKSAKYGESFRIRAVVAGRIIASHGIKRWVVVTKKQAKCFDVFERTKTQVGKGDKLLLQKSMVSDAGRLFWFKSRFRSGEIVEVKRHDVLGRIVLKDGRVLPRDYQQYTHAWVLTPYAAQNRTADSVVLAARWMARESFYVAASRGRESIDVFTDDRAWLQDSIKTTSTRMAALEFEKELGRKGPSMERGADMSVGKGMRG